MVIGASVLPIGCANYGAGGTGEWIVPRQKLGDIQPLDLSANAVPPDATASTAPSANSSTSAAASAFHPTSRPATTAPTTGEVPLGLEDVRRMALQNNLDLRVELFNPTIARESLTQERAAYESVFTTNASFARIDEPTANRLVATTQQSSGLLANNSQSVSVTPGLRIPLLTGGVLSFSAINDWQQTTNPFTTLDEFYGTAAQAHLSLPLLRGFGIAANARAIRVAFYESQAAQARTKLEVIRVLAEAERAYWRVYAAERNLAVQRQQHELAVAQLNRARHQAEVGVSPEVEVIRAESGVADAAESVISAANNLRNLQRDLKRILNNPGWDVDSPVTLLPATPPAVVTYQLDAPQIASAALQNRMELLETELAIAQETANVAAARNATLPLVTLDYTYTINGLGTDLGQSWTLVRTTDFQDHRVGLNVEIPIGNEAARSQLRTALARRLQQLATHEQRTLQIRQEVFNAIDHLQTDWQHILTTRERVRLSARTLDAEIRQFEQGLRTSTDVLDATFRLASAQSDQIAAVTSYQIDQIDLAFATGTLLGAAQVHWDPAPAPAVR